MTSGEFLYRELGLARQRAIAGGERAWLNARGVSCPLIGCTTIRAAGADLFEPADDGYRAFVFGVLAGAHLCGVHNAQSVTPRDLAGHAVALVDLAAWRPSEPDRIMLRRGAVSALGDWNLDLSMSPGEALRLFGNPIAWAAADFAGVVVVDWKSAAPALLEWPEILCDTLDLGEALDTELRKARRRIVPRLPKIAVLAA